LLQPINHDDVDVDDGWILVFLETNTLFAFFLISGRKVSIVTAPFCQATLQFSGLIFPNSKPSSKGFCGCGWLTLKLGSFIKQKNISQK
jgi:hypothetical protein